MRQRPRMADRTQPGSSFLAVSCAHRLSRRATRSDAALVGPLVQRYKLLVGRACQAMKAAHVRNHFVARGPLWLSAYRNQPVPLRASPTSVSRER